MSAKPHRWTTLRWPIALLAVGSCVAPGSFCDVVRGPLEFEAATAAEIVRTDRPTAEAIDAQNAYWRGNCGAAWGQEIPRYHSQNGDEYQLTLESDILAVVEFLNSAANMSPGGRVDLHHDGLTVTTRTVINEGAGGAERLRVEAPEGWWADPEFIDVRDGEAGVIILRRGEWHGM